jgi:hypothetical protein
MLLNTDVVSRLFSLSLILAIGWGTAAGAQSTALGSPPQTPSAQERLTEAQTRNQEAQARYYEGMSESWNSLFPAVPGMVGVIIGAAMSFLGLRHQAKNQEKLEDLKLRRAHADERRREIQLAAADLSKRIAMAAHSMTWVTWIAKHDPEHFSPDLVDQHDRRMDALYSELVSAQVVVAALSSDLYQKTLSLVKSVYWLDAKIAEHAIHLPGNVRSLGDLWSQAKQFEDEVPKAFLGLLEADSAQVGSN